MLADAFHALKTFDWGTDIAWLRSTTPRWPQRRMAKWAATWSCQPIAALNGPLSRDAHDYVCCKLSLWERPPPCRHWLRCLEIGRPPTWHATRWNG